MLMRVRMMIVMVGVGRIHPAMLGSTGAVTQSPRMVRAL
jgi:hypothetical protein